MGCGCNKRRKRRTQQSSRMPIPSMPEQFRKISGIKVPEDMTPNQRRSTIAKIKNARANKTISDHVRDRKSQEG